MNTSKMITLLQLLALILGIQELWAAKEYYKQQKKRWAIASLCMGILLVPVQLFHLLVYCKPGLSANPF